MENEIALADLQHHLANKKRAHDNQNETENAAHSIQLMERNGAHYGAQTVSSQLSMVGSHQLLAVDGSPMDTTSMATSHMPQGQDNTQAGLRHASSSGSPWLTNPQITAATPVQQVVTNQDIGQQMQQLQYMLSIRNRHNPMNDQAMAMPTHKFQIQPANSISLALPGILHETQMSQDQVDLAFLSYLYLISSYVFTMFQTG